MLGKRNLQESLRWLEKNNQLNQVKKEITGKTAYKVKLDFSSEQHNAADLEILDKSLKAKVLTSPASSPQDLLLLLIN